MALKVAGESLILCKQTSCLVGTIYRPPSEQVSYWHGVESLLYAAVKPGVSTVICGDFNVNMDTVHMTDPQLEHLRDLTSSYSLHEGVCQATRFATNGSTSTIDLIFNTFEPNNVATVLPVAFSDHAAIISSFSVTPPSPQTHSSSTYRNIKAINIDRFRHDLSMAYLCSVTEASNVSEMWSQWTNPFHSVYDDHWPVQARKPTHRCHVPWMDQQLMYLLRKRNRLHRTWLKERTDRRYESYRLARSEATSCNREKKRSHYLATFSRCEGNPRRSWQVIKELTGKVHVNPPPQCSAEEISAVFATNVDDKTRPPVLRIPSGAAPRMNLYSFQPVPIAKVRKLLQSVNSTKTTGSDGIPTVLLRLCGDMLAPSLTLLFNISLREGKLPESMKVAGIRPLFKDLGDHRE